MKILFLGVFNERSTSVSQAEAFEDHGCAVIRYDYRAQGQRLGNMQRDQDIVNVCRQQRPELILFAKCNGVNPEVVTQCNQIGKTCLWFMDPMRSYNRALIEKIKIATFTCCALPIPFQAARMICDRVHFLFEGYDGRRNYPVEIPYKHDVSFIGHLRKHRRRFREHLEFHVYKDMYGHKHSIAVCESKINLNFTEGGTSDRTYKVLASKGFLLTEPWPDMEEFVVPGRDLEVFQDPQELKAKIAYYLQHEQQRRRIAETGMRAIQPYSRINWARKILELANGS